jgi:hypothetical protein
MGFQERERIILSTKKTTAFKENSNFPKLRQEG